MPDSGYVQDPNLVNLQELAVGTIKNLISENFKSISIGRLYVQFYRADFLITAYEVISFTTITMVVLVLSLTV